MIIQITEQLVGYYKYLVFIQVGTKDQLLKGFKDGDSAISYAESLSKLLNCELQYAYETAEPQSCTKEELLERMDW